MKNQNLAYITFIVMVILCKAISVNAQVVLDIESGVIKTGYNDVRIPGDQGTLFSLNEDLNAETPVFFRLRGGFTINSRHTISLLYAPLTVNSEGSIARTINFEGVTFPSLTHLNATYQFNSYRLTYRYEIVRTEKAEFGIGITAKIRDAKIALKSTGSAAEKTNFGFVPLINLRLFWQFDKRYGLLIEGDALAAKQGRAEDAQVALTYNLAKDIRFRAGYRILEGGADNSEVYNFALIHYASVGLTLSF
jgi:hypothetical protein